MTTDCNTLASPIGGTAIPLHCTVETAAVGRFLARYASWLMGAGATCIRVEKNMERIARTYCRRVEMTIFPRHIQLSVYSDDENLECLTVNAPVRKIAINYDLITRLSELSWRIADNNLDLPHAEEEMNSIVRQDARKEWLVLLLVGAANASFCRLFGGDGVAMAVVFIATVCGFWLKNQLMARGWDVRLVFLICAFVSGILGCTDIIWGIGSTPRIALATSVLYLVPGIPFLNSFSDLLNRHYICAFSRFMDAVVLTCCLSAGLCLAMVVMKTGMF